MCLLSTFITPCVRPCEQLALPQIIPKSLRSANTTCVLDYQAGCEIVQPDQYQLQGTSHMSVSDNLKALERTMRYAPLLLNVDAKVAWLIRPYHWCQNLEKLPLDDSVGTSFENNLKAQLYVFSMNRRLLLLNLMQLPIFAAFNQ